ncbi:MAG: PEP-CTERM sorting domain-containing protein [Planctomycetota bacterium]|nr:MAG: PEP-CTERM sorting domain-containing protein [Planctomycetota bacterium]
MRSASQAAGGVLFIVAALSPSAIAAELFAGNWFADSVNRYDTTTGALISTYTSPNLDGPAGVAVSDAGELFVMGDFSRNLLSFDVATGVENGVIDSFTFPINASGDLEIGPDGDLYAVRFNVNTALARVYRYDGQTGALLGAFTPFDVSIGGITFGADGDLYVSDRSNDQVLQFDGQTGNLIGTFASGNLVQAGGLAFGPDGNLYVADAVADAIVRFDGASGAFLGTLDAGPQLDFVEDIAFDPNGLLYASVTGNSTIRRYDPAAGAFVDVFATGVLANYIDIIPEPGTVSLLALGFAGLAAIRRTRRLPM